MQRQRLAVDRRLCELPWRVDREISAVVAGRSLEGSVTVDDIGRQARRRCLVEKHDLHGRLHGPGAGIDRHAVVDAPPQEPVELAAEGVLCDHAQVVALHLFHAAGRVRPFARRRLRLPRADPPLRAARRGRDRGPRPLAASQRALEVGLLVTVAPTKELELIISKDGAAASSTSTAQPLDIEADGELELAIPGIATLHVRGGRRQAQEGARLLQDRWQQEVVPHFIRAGVTDMEGLERRLGDGQELDASITAKDAELKSLNREIAALSRAADELREASNHLNVCRAALTTVDVSESLDDSLSALKELGADAISSLRERRRKAMLQAEVARKTASKAQNDVSLEEDRARNLELALTEAIRMRDNALTAFPNGLAADLATARKAVVAANTERERVVGDLASLDRTIQERKQHIDAMLADTRNENEEAKIAVGAAQRNFLDAKTGHASADATLAAVRKLFEAENLAAALANLNEAQKRCAALPVPHRIITSSELTAAADKLRSLTFELQHLSGEIHKAQGALEQVGGAVVRERLRDAIEAFELAERLEKETEAEYEAWKLLLEQMKEADAAQASNLGQVLAPAIASRFQDLTQKRYETVCLNPHLGTEGVLVGGTVRDTERISVGTREQLSTLYRLCLAEYLQTMIVLDDQLVQSDETRMDWFRSLLTEKARSFQIVVFTCRPADYLARNAMPPNGNTIYADSDDGLIRAINLERVLNGAHGL